MVLESHLPPQFLHRCMVLRMEGASHLAPCDGEHYKLVVVIVVVAYQNFDFRNTLADSAEEDTVTVDVVVAAVEAAENVAGTASVEPLVESYVVHVSAIVGTTKMMKEVMTLCSCPAQQSLLVAIDDVAPMDNAVPKTRPQLLPED